MIRAVLFDLDDTLFDHQHCAREALAGVRSIHPCFERTGVAELERAHAAILEALHVDVMAGRLDLDVARVERFRRLYQSAGIDAEPALAERTAASYRSHYLSSRRATAGARELLQTVHARARIAIVSNNLGEEQRDKLRHCDLDRYVDVLVVSEEAGMSKPDPEIFRIALARLRCGPEEAVMVGDSWSADVLGARAAGIRPVWFNRNGAEVPADGADVAVISSFEPAAEILEKIFATT